MNPDQLELIANVVGAYVTNNAVPRADLANLIADVSRAFTSLGAPAVDATPQPTPAVNPKKSVFPDYIVSLEDGKQYRTLKRHLSGRGMTPAEYRQKWGLPRDYPMVAESYAAKRSELAKSLGLGRKAAAPATEEEAAPDEPAAAVEVPAKLRRGRSKKAAAAEA